MLDLFCGRWGWSRAFAARGWECVGVDLTEPTEIPHQCLFHKCDVLTLGIGKGPLIIEGHFDFICASSPCEQFSVHGLKCFFPDPPYPGLGIRLFNHTRELCEASGIAYVMENVRAAEKFVGAAVNHCGPFYLWGNAVPPMMPQGIRKGMDTGGGLSARGASRDEIREYSKANRLTGAFNSQSKERRKIQARNATIPPELANCVADYAERLLEQKAMGAHA